MGNFVEHTSCDKCGSSDAKAVYEDGSAYCFSCKHSTPPSLSKPKVNKMSGESNSKKLFYSGEIEALHSRKISKDTAKMYKVLTTKNGSFVYPLYDDKGELIASKVRVQGKKKFAITGDFKQAVLFGQQLFGTNGGKILTITEGQDDAMAAYQMGGKFPAVSVHSATSAVKDVKRNLDFIESYDTVRIVFDNDEAGREAARAVAEVISPNKVEIVTLTKYKDANEYLIKGDISGYTQDFWNAKKYSPAGVVCFEDALSSVRDKYNTTILPLPESMPQLSGMLNGGIAKGEITVVGALTSIGKTTFVNNFLYGVLQESESKVGYLGLETTVGELTASLLDLHSKSKVTDRGDMEETEEVFNDIEWKNRLYILDHQGSLEMDEMIRRIRNIIVTFDLDLFIIDPLQQSLPDMNNDTVKHVMDAFLKIAKQTSVSILIVSHMRKPTDDKPHSVSEYDLLGSSAINQVAFNTLLLSRDKMGATDKIKSSTKLHLVKCRRTGKTGQAGWLFYNHDTGHLEYGTDPYDLDDEDFDQ